MKERLELWKEQLVRTTTKIFYKKNNNCNNLLDVQLNKVQDLSVQGS